MRITDGSRQRLAYMSRSDSGWQTNPLDTEGESLGQVAVSPSADHIAYSASNPDLPAAIYQSRPGGKGRLVDDANGDLHAHVMWSAAEDMEDMIVVSEIGEQ